MKNFHKATLGMIFAIIVVLIMIILDSDLNDYQQPIGEKDNDEIINGDHFIDVPYHQPEVISKALAVKMIALAKEEKESIAIRDREIDFSDSKQTDWFDKYFNVAIVDEWYKPEGTSLNPLDALTKKEAMDLAKNLEIDLESNHIVIDGKDGETITYEEWLELFNIYISQLAQENAVTEKILYVFATPTISTELKGWEIATDYGKYGFEGITIDGCMNKEIKVITKGQEILYVKEIVDEQPILTNAYMISIDDQTSEAEVFMGGVTRYITIDNHINLESKKGFIADIQINGNTLTSIKEKNKMTKGVISKITDVEVEIKDIGKMRLSQDIKFYDVLQKPTFTSYKAIIVGYDTATFVLDENQVVAAVIREKAKIDHIRVVINTTGFQGVYHDHVILSSVGPYQLKFGDKMETLEAGKETDISQLNLEIGERITFTPDEGRKIKLLSVKKGANNQINPEYRGIIEVEREEKGYLIVNEIDFEEYLYGVVPSEMPTSYGLEAAKVQAVCARSYAYNQIYSNRFCQYGAHVDDSTSSQVYNNTMETEMAIQAVNETKGQLLAYEGNVISTNFFSTSCGMTADGGDVWANYLTKDFPTTTAPYLTSAYQNDKGSITDDLSKEDDFKRFIMNKKQPSFDADYPWYRWSTQMTTKQIEAAINKAISKRYDAQPKLIKTLDDKDVFRSREVNDIGELIDLWIFSRGDSGIITEMVIQGTKGVYKISTEYNIRALIAPINYVEGGQSVIITRNDGNTSKDMSLMPSAFYIMEKKYNEQNQLDSVTFYGGGYGHGVGMSQNGAKTMVDLGYSYEEILKHYYRGTELITLE